MKIRAGLYSAGLDDYITKRELRSRVHVVNGGAREKETVDPSKDPVIVLTKLYLDLVALGKYDLIKLGRCWERVFWLIIVDNVREVRAPLLKCVER